MKVKLVGYRCAIDDQVGMRSYICEEENKRFKMYRNFDKSDNVVAECIENENTRLMRYFKNGRVIVEELTIDSADKSSFCSVNWKDGIPVEGYTLITDKRKPNIVWEYLGDVRFVFMNAQEKKYLNVPEMRSNITPEEARKDILKVTTDANMKKVALIAVAKKVPEKMGALLELAVGAKTFFKDRFCR